MTVQSLLPGVLGKYIQATIVRYIYRPYIRRSGRIIYPRNAKVFRFPVYDYK